MAGKAGLAHIRKIFDLATKGVSGQKSFDFNLEKVNIIAGGNGSVTALMKVEYVHCNQGGFLHGGMTALLVDVVSGVALSTHPDQPNMGVSLNMNLEYTKPCFAGQEIVIKASTEKVGKRIAFLKVDIFNHGTGELVAKGTHIKFI